MELIQKDNEVQAAQVPNSFSGPLMYDVNTEKERWDKAKECLAYAIYRFDARRSIQIRKINVLMDNYNGNINERGMAWINKQYGKDNMIKYVDWRLGRTKIDLLVGEWLKGPINATCYTVNKSSIMQKLDDYHAQLGLKYAQAQAEKIKNVAGVEVFDGMKPMQGSAKDIWEKVNAKTRNEQLMQIILNKMLEVEDIKTKLASNKQDLLIAAECFSKSYIDENGMGRFRDLDPRDALFEEIERDPFLLQSPYLGERRLMFEHDVYHSFPGLTAWQRERIKTKFVTPNSNSVTSNATKRRSYFYNLQGYKAVETFTIEWYAVKPDRVKTFVDKDGKQAKKSLSNEYYDANAGQIKRDVKAGRYKIDTKYKLVLWEATQIGEDVWTNVREKPNIIGSLENPFWTTSSYSGLLFNTKDGVRVSLQQSLDHLSELYNAIMYQIRRELNKAKGKVIPYDKAMLPKGTTMKQVLHRMINDGIYEYNSAEDGNMGETTVKLQQMFREIDLGISATVSVLRDLKREIEETADKLTGINENREGNTPASSTLGSANNNIQLSRTITEYQSYMFQRYTENCLKKVMENGKISFGELNPDLGRQLLGDSAIKFLDAIMDIPNDSFGLYLADPRKEMEVRQMLREWVPQAINAQEMRVVDGIQIALGETMDEAIQIAKSGWETVQMIKQKDMQDQMKSQQMNTEAMIAGESEKQAKLAQNKIDVTIIGGLIKAGLLTQEAANQFMADMKMAQMEQAQVDQMQGGQKQAA
jgi:hypothetical protein